MKVGLVVLSPLNTSAKIKNVRPVLTYYYFTVTLYKLQHSNTKIMHFINGEIILSNISPSFYLFLNDPSCIFPIIPFSHASLWHSSLNPKFIHLFNPAFIHHLQALFARRFFSCSCQLRRRWKVISQTFDLWLQLLIQLEACAEALNYTTVHALHQAVADALDNLLCVSYNPLKHFNLSLIHFWTRLLTFLRTQLTLSLLLCDFTAQWHQNQSNAWVSLVLTHQISNFKRGCLTTSSFALLTCSQASLCSHHVFSDTSLSCTFTRKAWI